MTDWHAEVARFEAEHGRQPRGEELRELRPPPKSDTSGLTLPHPVDTADLPPVGEHRANGHSPARSDGDDGPRVVKVADVVAERVRWLWPGYIPAGKLTVVDGDPGDGKSTLTLDLAARVSTGSPMPDGAACQRGNVLVLSAEDGIADTIRPRLDAAGADVDRVAVFDEVVVDGKARPVSLPGDFDHLAGLVAAHRVALVTIDPLMAFLGGGVDSHRDQDVRGALHPLAKLADATGAAILVVRHMNKAGGSKAVYRGGGSIGIIGAARAGYVVAPDPDDEQRRVLACSKMNVAVGPPSLAYRLVADDEHGCAGIVWEGPVEHRAGDLLTTIDQDERTKRDEVCDVLADVLADGAVPAKRARQLVQDATGASARTVDTAKARLGVVSRKQGMDGGWVWVLEERNEAPKDVGPKPLRPSGDACVLRDDDGPEGAHETPKAFTPEGGASSGVGEHLRDAAVPGEGPCPRCGTARFTAGPASTLCADCFAIEDGAA